MSNVIISVQQCFDDMADFHHDKERKDECLEQLSMEELFCSSAVVLLYFVNCVI